MIQGEKFLDRFDAVTYVKITEQMDTHDVGRNRGGMAHALSTLMKCRFLVLGIDSDVRKYVFMLFLMYFAFIYDLIYVV